MTQNNVTAWAPGQISHYLLEKRHVTAAQVFINAPKRLMLFCMVNVIVCMVNVIVCMVNVIVAIV